MSNPLSPNPNGSPPADNILTRANDFIRDEGIRGIIRVAHRGYLRYQSSGANYRHRTQPNENRFPISNSESAIWGDLQYREFLSAGDEEDPNVGAGSILPVRALMSAKLAVDPAGTMNLAQGITEQVQCDSTIEDQVLSSLSSRWTLSAVARLTTSQEAAIVVYAASSLGLGGNNGWYLEQLVQTLKLPTELVESVEQEISSALSADLS